MKAMDQRSMPKVHDNISHQGQFQYLGRWVDKEHFCAFVYDKDGNEKLAQNYNEFEKLTTSGIWFASREDASLSNLPKIPRKIKDGITLSDGK